MSSPAVKCEHCDFQIAWEAYDGLPADSVFLCSFLDARVHYLNTGHRVIAVEIFINATPTGGIRFELDFYKRFSLDTAERILSFYRTLESHHEKTRTAKQFLAQTESLLKNN